MLQRIINNLKKPHKIIPKLIYKLIFFYKKNKYNKEFFENHQNEIFKKLNLDRNLGLKKLINIKNQHNFLIREMSSEHEVLFSSLSLNSQIKINKILEIGTFDGKNCFLLSALFDNSIIETIDLEKQDDDFKKFYNRQDQLDEFVDLRNNILSKNKKITFNEMNSVKLFEVNKNYDLIWIDGAHGYPIVCFDIINSLKLINKNGIIMCDDVYIDKINSDKMYFSNAAYETLNELKKANIINFHLIYKRIDSKNNCDVKKRKFVAIIKKI